MLCSVPTAHPVSDSTKWRSSSRASTPVDPQTLRDEALSSFEPWPDALRAQLVALHPADLLDFLDDDELLVELVTFTLESHGHEVMTAEDGIEGIELAAREAPDIVVLDWETLSPGPERRVRDFPAGGERLTADAPRGVDHVLVAGVPIRREGRSLLDEIELRPFRAAADVLPSLMTAHVVFEALDPAAPATMSHKAIAELLREEIGFGGAVFSDDLEMKADRIRVGEGPPVILAQSIRSLVIMALGYQMTSSVVHFDPQMGWLFLAGVLSMLTYASWYLRHQARRWLLE